MSGAVSLTPYARALGITVLEERAESGAPILAIAFGQQIEGRSGVLHGGAIGGLLETAGYAALAHTLRERGEERRLKPINVTVQFLSSGKPKVTHAEGRIVRLGRRVANIAVEAWQDDRERPIATAVMNVMVVEAD